MSAVWPYRSRALTSAPPASHRRTASASPPVTARFHAASMPAASRARSAAPGVLEPDVGDRRRVLAEPGAQSRTQLAERLDGERHAAALQRGRDVDRAADQVVALGAS